MKTLAEALSVHFPLFKDEPYFEESFSHMVEERHAAEAIEVTQTVLRACPRLLAPTLRDAKIIAEAFDGVWTHLDPDRPARRRNGFAAYAPHGADGDAAVSS